MSFYFRDQTELPSALSSKFTDGNESQIHALKHRLRSDPRMLSCTEYKPSKFGVQSSGDAFVEGLDAFGKMVLLCILARLLTLCLLGV
jgi:hypothetical protein